MGIPRTVDAYLGEAKVAYDLLDHPPTFRSQETALSAKVPPRRLAKAVVLRDRRSRRPVMAVLPADSHLELRWLRDELGLDLQLAEEHELEGLFPDCRPGAVPPFGEAYNLTTIWDQSLVNQPDLYFEAGDHEHLIHLGQAGLSRILRGQPHAIISSREH
ncbi:MAG TPA: YbaK/EbsC family protein [Holophagaceae bacterium]|nr:YbaK/EbsC family protein [Holophagaceae bacterium]